MDHVMWMEWPVDKVLDPAAIHNSIQSESLSVLELYLIGEFKVANGLMQAPGYVFSKPVTLGGGELPTGKTTVRLTGFKDGGPTVTATIVEPIEPKNYQPLSEQKLAAKKPKPLLPGLRGSTPGK